MAKKAAAKKPVVKKAKKRVESYGVYVHRVLKSCHPDTGISKKAMAIMNSFVGDMFDKLAAEAGALMKVGIYECLN